MPQPLKSTGESSPSDNDSQPEETVQHQIELPKDIQNYDINIRKRGYFEPDIELDNSQPEKIIKHQIELPNDTQNYNIKNSKRGHAIIITHETFDYDLNLKSRPPADIDERNAKKCLESLGFTIHSYKDNTHSQLMKLADKEAPSWDHENSDCLFVVISTHGGDDGLLFSLNKLYYLEIFVEKFAAIESLAGKPKIFIVQACRGSNVDQGVETTVDAELIKDEPVTIPLLPDCLILYSSYEGYVSFRDNKIGSWLLRSFFDALQKNPYDNDILSIMRDTTRKVAFDLEATTPNAIYDSTKQMPTLHSFLTRKLQFLKKPGELEKIIKPQRYQNVSDQILRLYKMEHKNRGKAIIFNFENFDENMLFFIQTKIQPNQGRNINVEENIVNLQKTLENYGFNVEIFEDLNLDYFIETLDKLSKYNYTDSDCLMIIINTYGYENKILIKDNLIEPNEIFNYFFGNNCTTLIGKPKLFFMNITNHPSGLSNDFKSLVRDESITNNTNNSNENVPMISLNEELTKIPETADILIMYSSTFGITYEENHSYFLKELHGQLSSNLVTKDKSKEILDILTEVNRCVTLNNNILMINNDKSKTKKIITRIVSTLTKELYLK